MLGPEAPQLQKEQRVTSCKLTSCSALLRSFRFVGCSDGRGRILVLHQFLGAELLRAARSANTCIRPHIAQPGLFRIRINKVVQIGKIELHLNRVRDLLFLFVDKLRRLGDIGAVDHLKVLVFVRNRLPLCFRKRAKQNG